MSLLLSQLSATEDNESWWAGAVNCMVSVGVAGLLAANTLSAQLPVAGSYQQDEVPVQASGGNTVSLPGPRQGIQPYVKVFIDDNDFVVVIAPAIFDEDLWVVPLPPVPSVNSPLYIFDTDTPVGVQDEDYWVSGVAPVQATLQSLPLWLADQNENAAGLYGVPEEEFWFIPKALPPITYAAAITVDDDIVPQPAPTISVDDSDGWQNRVAPVPATLRWTDPSVFEQHENATGLYGQAEEEYWVVNKPQYVAPIVSAITADDEMVTPTTSTIVEDEGWLPPVPAIAPVLVEVYLQLEDDLPFTQASGGNAAVIQSPRQSAGPYVRIFLGEDEVVQPPPPSIIDETDQTVYVAPQNLPLWKQAFVDEDLIVPQPAPPSLTVDETDQAVYVVSQGLPSWTKVLGDDDLIVPQPAPSTLTVDETDQQVYVPRYIYPQVAPFVADDETTIPIRIDETDQAVYVPLYVYPQVSPFTADDEITTPATPSISVDEDFWIPPVPGPVISVVRAFVQPEFEVPAILAFTPGSNTFGAVYRAPRQGVGPYVRIFLGEDDVSGFLIIPLLVDETDQQVRVPQYVAPQVAAFIDDDIFVPFQTGTPLNLEDNDQPVRVAPVVTPQVLPFTDDDNWILPPFPVPDEGVLFVTIQVSDNILTGIIADDDNWVPFVGSTPLHVDETDRQVITPFKVHGIPPVKAFTDEDFVGIPTPESDGLTIISVANVPNPVPVFSDDDVWVPAATVTPLQVDDDNWQVPRPQPVWGLPPVAAPTADDDYIPFVGDTADGLVPLVITSYSPLITGIGIDEDVYPMPIPLLIEEADWLVIAPPKVFGVPPLVAVTDDDNYLPPLKLEELDWQVIPPPKVFGIPPVVAMADDDNYATPIIIFETDLPVIAPPVIFGIPPVVAIADDDNWVPFVAPTPVHVEEDYWQNPVAPVVLSFIQPRVWEFEQNDPAGTLGAIKPEEDFWRILTTQPPYVTTRAILVDDEIVPQPAPLCAGDDSWQVSVPVTNSSFISVFTADDLFAPVIPDSITVDEEQWNVAIRVQANNLVWLPWHTDELRHRKRFGIINTGTTSITPLLDGTTTAPPPGGGTSSVNPQSEADTSIVPLITLNDTGV